MNFIYISVLVIVLALASTIYERVIHHRHVKPKWLYRLHYAAIIGGCYIIIQIYNPAAFLTAAAAVLSLVRIYDLIRNHYAPRTGEIALITEFSRDMTVFVIIFWAFRTFIFDYSPIPSGSMEPTLLAGDLISINKMAYQVKIPPFGKPLYRFSSPKRGEVVVFNSPLDPHTFYIKRVIAVGGDKVEYKNKQYFVNGTPYVQTEKQLDYTSAPGGKQWLTTANENTDGIIHQIQLNNSFGPDLVYDVPEGHLFVSGDNRDFSFDSRMFGPISEDLIVGRATHILTHFQLPTLVSFSRTHKLT
ncbi:MAG: signal peptidase I [Pseudomonadota bacterium]|nr:signal peptidase I [Pseudomonadota bacterium]